MQRCESTELFSSARTASHQRSPSLHLNGRRRAVDCPRSRAKNSIAVAPLILQQGCDRLLGTSAARMLIVQRAALARMLRSFVAFRDPHQYIGCLGGGEELLKTFKEVMTQGVRFADKALTKPSICFGRYFRNLRPLCMRSSVLLVQRVQLLLSGECGRFGRSNEQCLTNIHPPTCV